MDYLLLLSACFLNGAKSVFAKKSNSYINETHNIYTYNFYMFLIAFVISLIISLTKLTAVSFQTVIMALFYGFSLVFGQIFLIKAMNVGEVSVSTLVYSCSFPIPIFAGAFVYDEEVSLMQIIGVLLIIISFAATIEKGGKKTLKWFFFAILSLLCNGMVGLTQKVFGMSQFKSEQSIFMVIAFLAGMIVMFFIMPKKVKMLPSAGFIKTAMGSGVTLGLVNYIAVYISGVLPAIIVFPCVSGGGIIVSAILARILIGEKLSVRKKAGILICVFAMCLISI